MCYVQHSTTGFCILPCSSQKLPCADGLCTFVDTQDLLTFPRVLAVKFSLTPPVILPHFDLISNFQSLSITWKNTEATQTQHGTLFTKMFHSVLNEFGICVGTK
jgi:hypothetical protein